jgi:capsule polysaccharide export protein KpsE/RkpR
LKILQLVILLLPLLTPISYAQTQTKSRSEQNGAYGIEPEQFYPGSLVLELMSAAEAEIENAVREAYAEGYKAAMLQYAPEIAALKIRETALREELEKERKKSRFLLPSAGASFAAGILIHGLLTR